jgi:hypothetical protein
MDSCTKGFSCIGPIKGSELIKKYEIGIDEKNNNNINNRDFFIIDSEGLDSIYGETEWLKFGLCILFQVSSVCLYVDVGTTVTSLNEISSYIHLNRFISEKVEMKSGLGVILNKADYRENEDIINHDETRSKKIFEDIKKRVPTIKEENFEFFTVPDIHIYDNYLQIKLGNIIKFIFKISKNRQIMSGNVSVELLETLLNNVYENSDINKINLEKSFNDIFLNVVKSSLKRNANGTDTRNELEKEIKKRIYNLSADELYSIDCDEYVKDIDDLSLPIFEKISESVFSNLKNLFSDIYETELNNFRKEIVRESVKKSLIYIGKDKSVEIRHLGYGYNIQDGSFTRAILQLELMEMATKFGDLFVRLPENSKTFPLSIKYDSSTTHAKLTAKDFFSKHMGKFISNPKSCFDNEGIENVEGEFKTFPTSFEHQKNIASSTLGIGFSNVKENSILEIEEDINIVSHVWLDKNELKKYLNTEVKNALENLDNLFNEIKSVENPKIKAEVTSIYNKYGEYVSTSFFFGHYNISIKSEEDIGLFSDSSAGFDVYKSRNTQNSFGPFKTGSSSSSSENEINENKVQMLQEDKHSSRFQYGCKDHILPFFKDIIKTEYGSSFIPLSSLAPPGASYALSFWLTRWNAKPTTVSEYKLYNNIEKIIPNTKITLYWKGENEMKSYEVIINEKGLAKLDGRGIEVHDLYNYGRTVRHNSIDRYDLSVDPKTQTVILPEEHFYHRRYCKDATHVFGIFGEYKKGEYGKWVEFELPSNWRFRKKITREYFAGNGISYMKLLSTLNSLLVRVYAPDFSCNDYEWDTGYLYVDVILPLYVDLE